MGLRDWWRELETGGKVLVGLDVDTVAFLVLVPLVVVLAAVAGSFVLSLSGGTDGGAPAVPQAAFNFDYAAAAETATIQHHSGDVIDAATLQVVVDGSERAWDDADGTVGAGDETAVAAQPGQTVRVVWTGEERETMGTVRVP